MDVALHGSTVITAPLMNGFGAVEGVQPLPLSPTQMLGEAEADEHALCVCVCVGC